MKVNIGPYNSDILPVNKLENMYTMWRHDQFYLDEDKYDRVDKIVIGLIEKLAALAQPLNRWSNQRKRKIKIKYHNYDTWGLEHTLALIILPGLKQLKATNHGYGQVNLEDLPTACLKDASGEEQWEWVMDQMIWSFNELVNDCPEEDAFYTGNLDYTWVSVDDNSSIMKKGPNHTFNVDFDGLKKYNDRIQNGLNLFGKYYRGLWD